MYLEYKCGLALVKVGLTGYYDIIVRYVSLRLHEPLSCSLENLL
jgi:hypothetical protein